MTELFNPLWDFVIASGQLTAAIVQLFSPWTPWILSGLFAVFCVDGRRLLVAIQRGGWVAGLLLIGMAAMSVTAVSGRAAEGVDFAGLRLRPFTVSAITVTWAAILLLLAGSLQILIRRTASRGEPATSSKGLTVHSPGEGI